MTTLKRKIRKLMRKGGEFNEDIKGGLATINKVVNKALPFMASGKDIKFKTDKKHGHYFEKRWDKSEKEFMEKMS